MRAALTLLLCAALGLVATTAGGAPSARDLYAAVEAAETALQEIPPDGARAQVRSALAVAQDVADGPALASTLWALGDLAWRVDLPVEAEAVLRRAVRLATDPLERASMKLSLGRLLLGRGRLGDAQTVLEQARADDPASFDVQVTLAGLLADRGALAEAEALLEELVGGADRRCRPWDDARRCLREAELWTELAVRWFATISARPPTRWRRRARRSVRWLRYAKRPPSDRRRSRRCHCRRHPPAHARGCARRAAGARVIRLSEITVEGRVMLGYDRARVVEPGRRRPVAGGRDGLADGLAALPAARDEAVTIAALLPQARLAVGADATRHTVLAARGPAVLHLATHGVFALAEAGDDPTPGARAERGLHRVSLDAVTTVEAPGEGLPARRRRPGRRPARREARPAARPGRSHPYYWASFVAAGERADLSGRRPAPSAPPPASPTARGCACNTGPALDVPHGRAWLLLLLVGGSRRLSVRASHAARRLRRAVRGGAP